MQKGCKHNWSEGTITSGLCIISWMCLYSWFSPSLLGWFSFAGFLWYLLSESLFQSQRLQESLRFQGGASSQCRVAVAAVSFSHLLHFSLFIDTKTVIPSQACLVKKIYRIGRHLRILQKVRGARCQERGCSGWIPHVQSCVTARISTVSRLQCIH